MHVGLNLVFLVPGETGGMESYARRLLIGLGKYAPEVRVTSFVGRAAAEADGPWRDLGTQVVVPVDARSRVQWVRGEQQLLPPRARRAGVELVHSLGSTAPFWGKFRRVTTIHDLHYLHSPGAHFGLRGLGMRVLVPLSARRSHRVITDSQASRDDIVRRLGTSPEKVDVVPLGLDAKEPVTPLGEAELRDRYALGDGTIVLSPSAKRPTKNIARLLEAFALIAPDERPTLVIPGYPTPYEGELKAEAERLAVAPDVRFLGWLPEAHLAGLYDIARCVAFPSKHEGFGLPVLEAMARGVPVACSRASALPEVAGEAALYFDPDSSREMADAMLRLLRDADARERLRAAGHERAQLFTLEATTKRTVDVYRRALSLPSAS